MTLSPIAQSNCTTYF